MTIDMAIVLLIPLIQIDAVNLKNMLLPVICTIIQIIHMSTADDLFQNSTHVQQERRPVGYLLDWAESDPKLCNVITTKVPKEYWAFVYKYISMISNVMLKTNLTSLVQAVNLLGYHAWNHHYCIFGQDRKEDFNKTIQLNRPCYYFHIVNGLSKSFKLKYMVGNIAL